jgi:hypothetical protein
MTGYKGMKRVSPVAVDLQASAKSHGLTVARYVADALNRAHGDFELAAALVAPPVHPNSLRNWIRRNPSKIRQVSYWEAVE